MFISYNQNYEKIAMGLLSFVEDLKSVTRLQSEIESYKEEKEKKLFLWKDEMTENIVGIIGVDVNDDTILVRHISITPSFRHEGLVYKLLDGLKAYYPGVSISGTLETAPLIAKWMNKENEYTAG